MPAVAVASGPALKMLQDDGVVYVLLSNHGDKPIKVRTDFLLDSLIGSLRQREVSPGVQKQLAMHRLHRSGKSIISFGLAYGLRATRKFSSTGGLRRRGCRMGRNVYASRGEVWHQCIPPKVCRPLPVEPKAASRHDCAQR